MALTSPCGGNLRKNRTDDGGSRAETEYETAAQAAAQTVKIRDAPQPAIAGVERSDLTGL
jgi:hypothetical protein